MMRNSSALSRLCPGSVIGRPGISSWSFANAIQTAGRCRSTSQQARLHRDKRIRSGNQRQWLRTRPQELGRADHHRGAAAEPVQQRHHLRHLGHLHRGGLPQAQRRADHDAAR